VANADYRYRYHFDGVNIRTGPATWYTSVGLAYDLQEACEWAVVIGENINGNDRWIYHTNDVTSVTGYSSNNYLLPIAPAEVC
jgi:hypothetical protein